jgi:hypothetical protein
LFLFFLEQHHATPSAPPNAERRIGAASGQVARHLLRNTKDDITIRVTNI